MCDSKLKDEMLPDSHFSDPTPNISIESVIMAFLTNRVRGCSRSQAATTGVTELKIQLMGAAVLLVLTACGQEPATEEVRVLSSGIAFEYMDTSVRPGDDFFSYVNGKWIEETEIPADKPSYGSFAILR